ncbi:predicted protein [Nematostella vectensis]|uniref:Uncharacterized protein n=1 Tax=Nematostella vectensis TaxID=45351 RepID=A7T127_NEMVE|nr:predicted protein [Nematostella vectensis]|eukprot:XP_001622438.1 predicted protein [Nematostella vectensis]
MAGTFGCGFARVAVKQSYQKENGKLEKKIEQRWLSYLHKFGGEFQRVFHVDFTTFRKRSQALNNSIRRITPSARARYIEHFSSFKWQSLTEKEKKKHTLRDCNGCPTHHYPMHSLLASIPNNEAKKQGKGKNNPRASAKAAKSIAKNICASISGPFEKLTGMTFAKAQTKVPSLGLQLKKSRNQLKQERRQRALTEKIHMQTLMAKQDCDVLLATRQSYSQREKQRLALYFKTKSEASSRVLKRRHLENNGKCKKKRHSPPPCEVDFDKEGLLGEVNDMTDNTQINFSDLARRYGISTETKLGNMVVKEFLESEGVDLKRFQTYHRANAPRILRKLQRMYGGEVTVPVLRTNEKIKETLQAKIESGEYVLGEGAQTKVPSLGLQLKKSRNQLKQERRQRALTEKIHMQTLMAKQDCDVLLATRQSYSQREKQRLALYFKTKSEASSRVLKRRHLENNGKCKKKRHSPPPCEVDFDKEGLLGEVNDMTDNTQINFSDLARRYGVSTETKLGNMVVKEFLESEGVDLKRFQTYHRANAPRIRRKLQRMYGGEFLYDPAFFYTSDEMKEYGHGDVDVISLVEKPHVYIIGRCGSSEAEKLCYIETRVECLMDMGHKCSTSTEKQEKQEFERVKATVTGTKDKLRGTDMRHLCAVLGKQMRGVMSEKPQTVFDTLTEVSRLLYSHPSKRCPRDILRLHNQSFLHAMTLKEVIKETKSLTDRKLYGRYFHSLVVHSPIQSRLVSGRSVNTEQQERHFNTFSAIAENTSSRRPGEIITPGLVRMQAELMLADQHRNTLSEQESKINSIAKSSSALSNSIIPNRYILRHPNDYQAHLERISDFLLCGEGVWWRQVASGVEFS